MALIFPSSKKGNGLSEANTVPVFIIPLFGLVVQQHWNRQRSVVAIDAALKSGQPVNPFAGGIAMPYHIQKEQRNFKWTLVNNLPLAEVEKWGAGFWIVCCPLCSRLHNLNASIKLDDSGAAYEPVCISKPANQSAIAAWRKQHPEAVGQTRVWLKLRQPIVTPLEVEAPELAVGKAA